MHEQMSPKKEDLKGASEETEAACNGAQPDKSYEKECEQLTAILGSGISEERALKLLQKFNGDSQQAVNAFYDARSEGGGNADPARPLPISHRVSSCFRSQPLSLIGASAWHEMGSNQ